jgi:two-component system response regulator AtoC
MVAACQRYVWPGNLNELKAFVKRYLVTGEAESGFPESSFSESGMVESGMSESGMSESGVDAMGRVDQAAAACALRLGAAALDDSRARPPKSSKSPESLKLLIQGVKWEAERNAIAAALVRTGWNRKAAARMLKVSYRTMLYKIEQYKMRAPQPYLSPLPAGEFPGYEARYESGYEQSGYEEVKGNGEARYAKVR